MNVREISVLFIGNSFTQRNDLPGLIAAMAAEAEPPVAFSHDRVIANGASLRQHWNAGIARQKIESGKWTHVVLQEQSTLPIKNATRYLENVRVFHPVIQAAGAQTVLYLTWARKHALETQSALDEAVGAAARETGALVVPVGPVWREVVEGGEGPELWDADGSHPSAAGSYLAACVFSSVLFGAIPTGGPSTYRCLDSDQAAKLRSVARADRPEVGSSELNTGIEIPVWRPTAERPSGRGLARGPRLRG